jgi:hypothetical protein
MLHACRYYFRHLKISGLDFCRIVFCEAFCYEESPIPCLLDIPCYLLSAITRPNTFSPLCLFPLWPHSFSPRLLYSGLLQLESQSAASCSHAFTTCGLFHPEDRGDTFLRNVGLPEFYTAPHPRRQHSSLYFY